MWLIRTFYQHFFSNKIPRHSQRHAGAMFRTSCALLYSSLLIIVLFC